MSLGLVGAAIVAACLTSSDTRTAPRSTHPHSRDVISPSPDLDDCNTTLNLMGATVAECWRRRALQAEARVRTLEHGVQSLIADPTLRHALLSPTPADAKSVSTSQQPPPSRGAPQPTSTQTIRDGDSVTRAQHLAAARTQEHTLAEVDAGSNESRSRAPRTATPAGCRDYLSDGTCTACGGDTGAGCVAGGHCASKINETCTAMTVQDLTGFPFSTSYSACAATLVCVDCRGAGVEQAPCPPAGHAGANTSSVLLLLDHSPSLNLSGAFGVGGVYSQHIAGVSATNSSLVGSHLTFTKMTVGGSLNFSGSRVVGGMVGPLLAYVGVAGDLSFRDAVVEGDIAHRVFTACLVWNNLDLRGITVSGRVFASTFEGATVYGKVDMVGAVLMGGMQGNAWGSANLNLGVNLSGATIHRGIYGRAFASANLGGSLDLRGTRFIGGGLGSYAFANLVVAGDLDLSGADLSDTGIAPGSFFGTTVGGVFRAAGAVFPNNTLPVQMLYGLNAQSGVDFSGCGLEQLAVVPCGVATGCQSTIAAVALDDTTDDAVIIPYSVLEGGPFTGISMPVGISTVAVNLSHNRLTEIGNNSLLGITATTVDLSHNPDLSVFHPFWFLGIPNARLIITEGNPTVCERVLQGDSATAAYTFQETASTRCHCAAGTLGTGNFCTRQPCTHTLAALNNYSAATLDGGRFVPASPPNETGVGGGGGGAVAGVSSGGYATLHCPTGHHPNNLSAVDARCLGGAFELQTNPCVADTAFVFTKFQIAGIVLFCVLVAVVAGYFCVLKPQRRKARRLARTLHSTEKQTELNERLLDATRGELEEATVLNTRMRGAWKIEEADVEIGPALATGAFGVVHEGRYGGLRVAIKVLKQPLDEELYPDVGQGFARECETLMAIRHTSLLIFYGAGLTHENKPFMVTEFMARGSLKDLLADQTVPLDWERRNKFALQVARAMEYLHQIPIVHRDLKSENCLVSEQLNVKVCDFGTSKFLSPNRRHLQETSFDELIAAAGDTVALTATMTKGVGTILWMAPELFVGGSKYGPEVDVYSFGVIMWELATRERPWDEIPATGYIQFYKELNAALEAGRRPRVPEQLRETRRLFVAVMERCWATEPEVRPPFREVARLIA